MVLFELDLHKFFYMFSLNDKEALCFFTEQFELRSGESLKMADESDLAVMVKQIKATKPPFIGYFCSRPYAKSSILILKSLGLERSSFTIKDTLVSKNSNDYILPVNWAE